MKLRIIRGLQGSGKSTFAKTFGCLHIENDMFRMKNGEYLFDDRSSRSVKHQCFRFVEEALKVGIDVCVSNVFVRSVDVQAYVDLGKRYGADVEVYKIVGCHKNTHGVPEGIVNGMKKRWEDYRGEKIIKT